MKQDLLFESPNWRSRGYIPHLDVPNVIQLISSRLYDAVPEALIEKWKRELEWKEKMLKSDRRRVALRLRIEKFEDSGYGACWLGDDRIAAMVQSTLLYFDDQRYRIIAWCIMPNHVHVVVEIWQEHPLKELLHSWKSYSAHEANKILDRSGVFWFLEYHDRYVRDDDHLSAIVEYVEKNPVKAGLVGKKEEWRWSSARERPKNEKIC